MLRKYDLPNQHYNTFFFQSVSFYSVDNFIFVVEQETEVPPLQMQLQMPRSLKKSLFQSRQYVHIYSDSAMEEGFDLVLAVSSAKTFLCEMTQSPQFLWILPTLRVNTYTHPNEKVRVYTGNDYFIDTLSLPWQWISQYHISAEVTTVCGLHCINTIQLIIFYLV